LGNPAVPDAFFRKEGERMSQAPRKSKAEGQDHNSKRDPVPQSNTEKDPGDWVTGGEPMTHKRLT
jgi:hypothetical protein